MNALPEKIKDMQDTSSLLQLTFESIIEGLTGIASSDKSKLILSAGHIFQSLRKGQFLSQLVKEWNAYRDDGRIKDDYQASEQHYECLQEMLDFLDYDSPDKNRFELLKQIFLIAATESKTDRESLIPQQFMKVCRQLSSGEIIVMSTAYRISKTDYPKISAASQWLQDMARESGLNHASLVEFNEETLIQKKILSPRKFKDESGVTIDPHFRLTSLGFGVCEFLELSGEGS